MAIRKNLKKYQDLAKDPRLDPQHRAVIGDFNRLLNGDEDARRPGLRGVVVGEELERVATSALVGLYSVSDFNPGFVHIEREQVGSEMVEKESVTQSIAVAGNILLTGLPGGGKTLLTRTLASVCGMSFDHVQMTPDLTPRDLIVSTVKEGDEVFTYLGPVFSHVLLADEVNRATPKTQSAFMQRMSSGTVTYKERGKKITATLPQPSFTMATRNPIEQEGTYPLPEAQLDRFLYNIYLPLPSKETMQAVLRDVPGHKDMMIGKLTSGDQILACRDFIATKVDVPHGVQDYIVRLLLACRDPFSFGLFPDLARELAGEQLIILPPNSRAALHIMNSSKTLAAIDGKREASPDHVKKRFFEAVNHRFVFNQRARGLLARFGGVDEFIRLFIKGDRKRNIKGVLDVVPWE